MSAKPSARRPVPGSAARLAALVLACLLPGLAPVPAAPASDDAKDLSAEDKAALVAAEKEQRRRHDEAVKQAIDEFKKALREAKNISDRAALVKKLSENERDPKVQAELARFLGDPAETVRIEAMGALSHYRRDRAAAAALAGALAGARTASMQGYALDALGAVGHEIALPAIARHVTEKTEERVMLSAIRALGETNLAGAVPVLIEAWEKLEKEKTKGDEQKKAAEERLKAVENPLKASLAALTGQRHNTVSDYRTWWNENRASFRPKEETVTALCRHFSPSSYPGRTLPVGCVLREVWKGINGGGVNDLRRDGRMEKTPSVRGWLPHLDTPPNGGNDYGTRLRGYLHPAVTGEHTFWICSDDDSELWISPDDYPDGKALVAKRDGATGWGDWNNKPEQKSKALALTAGKRYYLEVLHKQGGGSDHLEVAWQPPGAAGPDIVPGSVLSPYIPLTESLEAVLASLGPLPAPPAAKPPPAPGTAADAGEGLAAHWPLDDGPGATTAAEATGRAPAAAVRGAAEWVPGVFGKGVRVDGQGACVDIPPSATLNRVQEGSFTAAVWFRPEGLPSGSEPDSEAGVFTKAGYHMGLTYNREGKFVASFWLAGDKHQWLGAASPCPPGAFHHVAMTVDKPAGVMRLYVNGRQAGEKRWEADAGPRNYGNSPWRLGSADPGGKQYRYAAKGVLDDARLYTRALPAAEIEALYKTGASAAAAAAAPPPPRPDRLVRAVNLNGPALVVDGVPWESGEGAENCLVVGRPYAKLGGPLEPPAPDTKGWMLRTGYANPGTMRILLGGLPGGPLKVTLHVWTEGPETKYGVSVGGKEAFADRSTGAPGRWEKLGPFDAEAKDGALVINVTGGPVGVSGVEVWKE